jgi:UDP-galactopyranose mutase
MKYDYLIVGAGLYGSVFANIATKRGKKCLVIDKRHHIGGNAYTENIEDINVHVYGAHIFHTSDSEVWQYMNSFAEFNNYINSPLANYKGEIYNLPFNMNTFNKLWGVQTPSQARERIKEQTMHYRCEQPRNLEEQAINLVGIDIYEKLIKGYTEKQWGRKCYDLPSFIIKRLPLRFTYNNNYFNDKFQGIPIGGYTQLITNMLEGIDVELEIDFFEKYRDHSQIADKLVFTGMIDEFFDYRYGALDYRSLKFESEKILDSDFQGNAVMNFTEKEVPYTRVIEHKHFEFGEQEHTLISREYPKEWNLGDEPYYPINNEKNNSLYEKYKVLADQEQNVLFGGRLGTYRYLDMDKVIRTCFEDIKNELGE